MAATQSHYRFGIDELAESTHGWYAAQDTNPAPGTIPLDTTFLLRFSIQVDATALSNADFEFQYRKNGGAWTQITTATTNVKAVTPTCWANTDNTTQRLTGNTGTFEASSQGCTTDGISGGAQFDIVANGNGETECALQLVSANLAPGDLIEFRLTRDGGVLIDTYAVTPALGIPLTPTVAPAETSKIAEVLLVALTVITTGLMTETVKVADSVQADIPATNLSRSVTAEDLKAGTSGRVDLIGLGNPIRITDGPVVAELVTAGGDLTALPSESLKVSESASGQLDLIASPSESLKVSESASGELLTFGTLTASPSESLKVSEFASGELDPLLTSPSESLKVSESASGELSGALGDLSIAVAAETFRIEESGEAELSQDEVIRISDAVSALRTEDLSTAPSESLKVADSSSVSLDPEQAAPAESLKVADTIAASLDEQTLLGEDLKAADALSATLNPLQASPSESLKISELAQAERVAAGTLSRQVGDEAVKVADGPPLARLNPYPLPITSEALSVVDALTVALTPELAAPSESLKVADALAATLDPEQASITEAIKIADALTAAIDPELASLVEAVKVADAAVVLLNPEQASPSESLKVSEELSVARIDAGTLTAQPSETVKVSESLATLLNPEQASPTESLSVVDALAAEIQNFDLARQVADEAVKVADILTVVRQQATQVSDEAVKVVDLPTAVLQLAVQVADEGLRVADGTPVGRLNPLQLVLTESVKVDDSQIVSGSGTTLVAILSEGLRVADARAVQLDPLEVASTESLKVTDLATAIENPEVANPAEALKVADLAQASLDHLETNLTESLKIAEEPLRFGGPRIIDLVGTYVTTLSVVGTYNSSQTISIVGTYGEGE